MRIPLSDAWLEEVDIEAVVRVLRSGRIALGPELTAFERAIADVAGVRHAVACSSGTAALHAILLSLGLKEGDVVLTTPFSFIASSNVILMTGAIPVFVDIDPDTLCPSPEALRTAIRSIRAGKHRFPNGKPVDSTRLRAMLLVDVFGMPAPWSEYEAIAKEEELALVDDSCEALGTRAFGRACGSFGNAGAFAFYPNKQITTGEGGVIVTDDDRIAAHCRSLVNQGRGTDGSWLAHVRLGYNYRMSDVSAALGRSQLGRIDEIISLRREVAARYGRLLADIPNLRLPVEPAWSDGASWFVYVVRLAQGVDRDIVMRHLDRSGVDCKPYFTPIPLQPFYAENFGYREGDFPTLDEVCSRVVALPFHTRLTQEEQETVAKALREAISIATR